MSTADQAPPIETLSASQIAERTASGELSVAEATERAIAQVGATAGTNALVQPRFEQARREAKQADARLNAGRRRGPLHGVPVSIKDCFAVAGLATTLGIPGYRETQAGRPARTDAPLVARLRAAGAIVLGKTNVPQAMLMHECANPVFGRTSVPGWPKRSPGGSTGGEAALVAAGASAIGLGSDLGGSIRQPAAACGVAGFKPSPNRLTIEGSQRAISSGMQAIGIQPGPIARTVADLDLAMSVLCDPRFGPRAEGESASPWPDYQRVNVSRMRIAWWTNDGAFAPAVGMARAVEHAAASLQGHGAECIRVEPPDAVGMTRIYLGLVSADAMASVRRLTSGRPVDAQLARQMLLARLPRWSRRLLCPLLRAAGQAELSDLLAWSGARSADSYWRLTQEAGAYRSAFWDRLADAAGGPVDVVLSPPYGLPALRHGTAVHLLRAASHAFLANLLGAPAGVVPVGRITDADEAAEIAARKPRRWRLPEAYALANAKGSAGLPTAVEVLAPPDRDAEAMAVMAAIESHD